MAVQSVDEVRELVDFAPDDYLVTSFYLNVDATEFPSEDLLATSFDSLIHDAEEQRKSIEDGLSHDSTESIRGDLARIREWFDSGFDRRDTRSLAIFSCSALDFWEVFQMPTPGRSAVSFDPRPRVGPIAAFLSHTKPTAVLVTDKQHARIFTMKGGEVREWTDFEDWVPQRSDQGGWSQNRFQRRSDEWSKHHLDHAAEVTLSLLKHYPFDWLILGSEVQTLPDLEEKLHPYLKDRIIGHISVRIDAPAAEIVAEAENAREEAESRHIDELIEQVQEFAGAGGRGAIGLADTLQALNEQKIHILLVQEGLTLPGSRCKNCDMLLPNEVSTCPACNEPATVLDDVVEAAIQKSMELGSIVEVATEQDKLEVIQGIGAVLYY